MEVTNIRVYDLEESVIASGLPMCTDYDESVFESQALGLVFESDNVHYKRACKLADNPAGSGHNNFLSGVIVSFNVTATQVWWQQFQRYHFAQIVSSQSKMHRLRHMLSNGNNYRFNPHVWGNTLEQLRYNNEVAGMTDEELVYNCPMGLELTARVTTNYLQLRTVYRQRKNHRLTEWHVFCDFIRNLPHAKEFIIGE
jgi:hypothetical protein